MTAPDRSGVSGLRRFAYATDIHSHPLPAIDDGAKSLSDSLMMLRVAARYGTSALVATPHRYWQGRENTPDLLRRLNTEVREALHRTKFGHRIELIVGQEIPLTLKTADELRSGAVLTLGDTGVYALVEPPFEELPDWTADALAAVVAAGFQPVLAHPERNRIIKENPEAVLPFVQAGAGLQLTGMSLTGENGQRTQAAAFWMLDRDLATVVASDSHSATWRPPTLRGAYHVLSERYSPTLAQRLCIENPRAIAGGQKLGNRE